MGMKRKTKKNYEAPQLTTVSFRAERGYATSGSHPLKLWEDTDMHILMNTENHDVEIYETGNGWNEGSNHFWD